MTRYHPLGRRSYLALAGTGLVGLSGCTGSDGGPTDDASGGDDEDGAETTTDVEDDASGGGDEDGAETPTDGGAGEIDEDDDVTDAERSLGDLDFEGTWFDSHAHWGDAEFFGDDDFDIADFTAVQHRNDVGAAVLFVRPPNIADDYEGLVGTLARDDLDYLLFVGPGRQIETVYNGREEVFWGVGEIPFYQGTPQHGMSLTDQPIPTFIEFAATNDLVLMLHPTMDQAEDIGPTLSHYPSLQLLLHGHELVGTDVLLDLLGSYDHLYFTYDVATMVAPLFDVSEDAEDFVERLDSSQSEMLERSSRRLLELLDVAPNRVMWGTDVFTNWHVEPPAYDRMMSFSEDLLQAVPAEHRDPYAAENAVALFDR